MLFWYDLRLSVYPTCLSLSLSLSWAFRFLQTGIALRLSPADVNVAVRVVERLALPAPPASLGYGSGRSQTSGGGGGSGGGKQGTRTAKEWPSIPVPSLQDEAFGITGEALKVQREVFARYIGGGCPDSDASDTSPRIAASPNDEFAVDFSAGGGDPGGYGPLHSGPGLRPLTEAVGKPSLCLVAGEALGADLLRWCTTACRSPEWRSAFSARVVSRQKIVPPPIDIHVGCKRVTAEESLGSDSFAGAKRSARDMEASLSKGECLERVQETYATLASVPLEDEVADGDAGGSLHDEPGDNASEGGEKVPGLAQLLSVVTQVVHAVKEHTKALATARGRAGAAVSISVNGMLPGAGSARSFDVHTRESSDAVQGLVGALAHAVLDAYADHMTDPALHRHLRQACCVRANGGKGVRSGEQQTAEEAAAVAEAATLAFSRRGTPAVIAEVAPLVDGSSPAETVGLSVDLVSDISWLFSALEPEVAAGGGSGSGSGGGRGGHGSAARAGPAAAMLSSAMSCWASGRILACMPGREQLEYALGLPSCTNGSSVAEGSGWGSGSASYTSTPTVVPSVRPLPARLAGFAVRTLLENAQVAREQGPGVSDSDAPLPPPLPPPLPFAPGVASTKEVVGGGGPHPASACAEHPTAFYRVALITEQMPAWRQRQRPRSLVDAGGEGEGEEANDEGTDTVAAIAARAAAAEVFDVLVAVLCATAEHERLAATRRVEAEAAGSQRRPTGYTVGSIGNVTGPALHAMSVLLGGGVASVPAGHASGGQGSGKTASMRASMVSRAKKRRGASDIGGSAVLQASSAADTRWRALVGLQLPAFLDHVHLSGLLLAWEPCHPWLEKVAFAGTLSGGGGGGGGGRTSPMPLKQSRSWQTFWSLANGLAQACVVTRPAPPPGKGLAVVMTRAIVSFRAACSKGGLLPFLDMPAVLLLCKVRCRFSLWDIPGRGNRSCGIVMH